MNNSIIRFLKSLIFFAAFASSPIFACETEKQKQEMAATLYKDKEFYEFTCGPTGCDFDDFLNRLQYRKEVVALNASKIFTCFVEPTTSAKNIYTGVFVVQGEKISPQFVFFGVAIQTINKKHRGYKILVGTELIEAGVWERHIYKWNGKVYAYRKEKKAH